MAFTASSDNASGLNVCAAAVGFTETRLGGPRPLITDQRSANERAAAAAAKIADPVEDPNTSKRVKRKSVSWADDKSLQSVRLFSMVSCLMSEIFCLSCLPHNSLQEQPFVFLVLPGHHQRCLVPRQTEKVESARCASDGSGLPEFLLSCGDTICSTSPATMLAAGKRWRMRRCCRCQSMLCTLRGQLASPARRAMSMSMRLQRCASCRKRWGT